MSLAVQHAHPRDARISFIDEGHVYIVDEERGTYTSVTTFVHEFFNPFEADKVLAKMRQSSTWSLKPYATWTNEEIKQLWETQRDEAASTGTHMHQQIEHFYNQESTDTSTIPTEWGFFQAFHSAFGCSPYRTEWYVFDEETKIAGSIDMVYLSAPIIEGTRPHVIIVDWKRTAELKYRNPFQCGRPPVEHLDDCNFSHYSLQLNIYRYILEKHYNVIVDALYLVILHPKNTTYQQVRVPDLSNDVRMMFATRLRRRGLVEPQTVSSSSTSMISTRPPHKRLLRLTDMS